MALQEKRGFPAVDARIAPQGLQPCQIPLVKRVDQQSVVFNANRVAVY